MQNNLFRQLQEAFLLMEDGNRQALVPVGLTPTQFNMLQCLVEGPKQGMTISQLAQVLLCTRGNATRLVQRLTASGLVRTRSDEQDGRIVVVTTTTEGKQLFRAADRRLRQASERRLAALPPRDQETLERLTDTLLEGLRDDLRHSAVAAPHAR